VIDAVVGGNMTLLIFIALLAPTFMFAGWVGGHED